MQVSINLETLNSRPRKRILASTPKTQEPGRVIYFRNWRLRTLGTCIVPDSENSKPWKCIFLFGPESGGSIFFSWCWKPWKCILFSDLKAVEVFTIFGSENRGSVHYFRIWKPWKCSLLWDLKTVGVHYFCIWKLSKVYEKLDGYVHVYI